MKSTHTDLELWEKMSQDDAGAFEEIYNRHSKSMFIYALNILQNKEVCEDIVQNVFIDFWSKRKDITILSIKPYLFQAVKFQVFKHLRDQKISNEDLTKLNIVDLSLDISKKIEFDELEALIHEIVDNLSPRCRQIFVLSRFHNKTNKEIASKLEITEQAVKNQISKAIKLIKENLNTQIFFSLFLLLGI